MARKSRKDELREFFEEHNLFMPKAFNGQEAIYTFVNSRRGNGLCGTTPMERIREMKEIQAAWSGKRVKHRKESGGGYVWVVRYVLPKTDLEIEKQRRDRGGVGFEISNGLSPFKACLESVSGGRSKRTVSLDILIREHE